MNCTKEVKKESTKRIKFLNSKSLEFSEVFLVKTIDLRLNKKALFHGYGKGLKII